MTSSLPVIWKNMDVSQITTIREHNSEESREKASLLKICMMVIGMRSLSAPLIEPPGGGGGGAKKLEGLKDWHIYV